MFWCWIRRFFNLSKHFEAGYNVSLTFQNTLVPDTAFPAPRKTVWCWIRRFQRRGKQFGVGYDISSVAGNQMEAENMFLNIFLMRNARKMASAKKFLLRNGNNYKNFCNFVPVPMQARRLHLVLIIKIVCV